MAELIRSFTDDEGIKFRVFLGDGAEEETLHYYGLIRPSEEDEWIIMCWGRSEDADDPFKNADEELMRTMVSESSHDGLCKVAALLGRPWKKMVTKGPGLMQFQAGMIMNLLSQPLMMGILDRAEEDELRDVREAGSPEDLGMAIGVLLARVWPLLKEDEGEDDDSPSRTG